jgi:hypothetical protein
MQPKLEPRKQPRAPDHDVARDDIVSKTGFEHIWRNQRNLKPIRRSTEEKVENAFYRAAREARREEWRRNPKLADAGSGAGEPVGRGDKGVEMAEDMRLELLTWGTGDRDPATIGAASSSAPSVAKGRSRGRGGGAGL